jgi:homoserine O-acetyltransferase
MELRIGDLPLEGGGTIRDCRLAWVEHGARNAAGDNTVLACCAIGSSTRRLDFLIGPGRALDPARWHVVFVDALGNGVASSPSNSPAQAGALFPAITIRDMVESQRRLLETLGIHRHAVIGASMGGMQALQWAASHPRRVTRVVAMTAGRRAARWSQLVNEISRRCLFEDAQFTRPRERSQASALWAPFTQMVVATSPQAVEDFADRDALLQAIAALRQAPDPFDWLCQTRAYDGHDAAVEAIRAPALLLAPPLDLYNPPFGPRQTADAIRSARFVEIPSDRGHRAATDTRAADAGFLNETIGRFLDGR